MSEKPDRKSADLDATKKFCEKCKPIILEYADEIADVIRDLRAIANLCQGVTISEFVADNIICQVGYLMDQYLDKQVILKHYFFDEPLDDSIDESVVAGELCRLKHKSDAMKKEIEESED